jgi:iron complex transport system permease protein
MTTDRRALLAAGVRLRTVARSRGRAVGLALVGLGVAVVALLVGVAVGTVAIHPLDTVGVVLERTLGIDIGRTWSTATETIVWDLRVPRVLTTMVVGLALAVAGATFQGLLRNPLADPYVLGTASGAALGAAIAVVVPVRAMFLGFGLVQVLSFVGALGAVFAVYRLSRISGLAPLTGLLLTGYAVGSLLAAGLALAMYVSGSALRQIFVYLLGGFDGATWDRLWACLPLVALGSILITLRARSLNGLLLGEETAAHLGVNVRRERAILLALASLVTAAAVTVSGLIGFVGLVVPHVVRLVVGPNARAVLPLSAVWGASLLAFSDIAARLLGEIPVGVVTAVIGAPFFLALLRRARTGYEL